MLKKMSKNKAKNQEDNTKNNIIESMKKKTVKNHTTKIRVMDPSKKQHTNLSINKR